MLAQGEGTGSRRVSGTEIQPAFEMQQAASLGLSNAAELTGAESRTKTCHNPSEIKRTQAEERATDAKQTGYKSETRAE